MLTWIKGWFGQPKTTTRIRAAESHGTRLAQPADDAISEPHVFSMRMRLPSTGPTSTGPTSTGPTGTGPVPPQKPVRSVLKKDQPLRRFTLCSKRQRETLRAAGITTLGDLARSNDPTLSTNGWFRVVRRAARLSLKIRPLHPQDALLVIAIHRKTVSAIASENPLRLQRDIERFVFSTRGSRLLGRRSAPTLERVTAWVDSAKQQTPLPETYRSKKHVTEEHVTEEQVCAEHVPNSPASHHEDVTP
jgi:hypothetical protein